MRAALLVFAAAAIPLTAHRVYAQASGQYVSPWKTPWDYEGPRGADQWSELDPAYAVCNQGKAQSPIDIRITEKADLPPLRFASRRGPIRHVVNNGHTIRVNYPRGNGNLLLVGGLRYELTQFHFHRPAEETVSGKVYPMEAHLMYQTQHGKDAGVTVFIEPGRASRIVETLWARMPATEGQNDASGLEVDSSDLLPSDTHSYYEYTGSVTAPPCTEGVTWYVLKTPIHLSQGQIDTFATLYPNDSRPVQPLNGRVVKESR